MMPWCDHTGLLHFHSSVTSGSASRISLRMRAKVSPRHPPSSRMRWSLSDDAGGSVAAAVAGAFFVAGFRDLLALGRPALVGCVFVSRPMTPRPKPVTLSALAPPVNPANDGDGRRYALCS